MAGYASGGQRSAHRRDNYQGEMKMFSGIVADVGLIKSAQDREGGLRLTVATKVLGMDDVQLGDSIAVNGVCLTVVKGDGNDFTVEVSRETLNCTAGLDRQGGRVNLEKALRLSDRLGGHLVSGHVDGVGEVVAFNDIGESWRLAVRAPQQLAKYIAVKGSITINGVSLTVNQVAGAEFEVNLIPHTLEVTTLNELKAGTKANLEIDLIARYVERMLTAEAKQRAGHEVCPPRSVTFSSQERQEAPGALHILLVVRTEVSSVLSLLRECGHHQEHAGDQRDVAGQPRCFLEEQSPVQKDQRAVHRVADKSEYPAGHQHGGLLKDQ